VQGLWKEKLRKIKKKETPTQVHQSLLIYM